MSPYELLARLFEYPGESYVERCREAGLTEFADSLAGYTAASIQELFIATFDWNPNTALEVGWHLFGEQYDRGEFLVYMRGLMRRFEVAESAELPDHLTHVLPVLARMDAEEATRFAKEFAAPAVAKLLASLEALHSPFAPLVRAVREALPVQAEMPALKTELPVLAGRD